MGTIVYNYAGIDSMGATIDAFIRQMDGTLDRVETELRPLEGDGEWKGAAQEVYKQKKDEWRAAATAITMELIQLKKALGEASTSMSEADMRAAGYFS